VRSDAVGCSVAIVLSGRLVEGSLIACCTVGATACVAVVVLGGTVLVIGSVGAAVAGRAVGSAVGGAGSLDGGALAAPGRSDWPHAASNPSSMSSSEVEYIYLIIDLLGHR
jgi:hypothetical protein